MRREPLQLRPNYYPDGPYYESVCIWCHQRLKHTGAWSGTTWIPVDTPPDGRPRDWWTCWSNEVARATYGQHEPWEARPIPKSEEDTMPNHVTNVIVASPEVIRAITTEFTDEERAEHATEQARRAANYKERTGRDDYPFDELPERRFTFASIIPEPDRMFHGGCDSNHPHPHPDGGFYDHCWWDWNRVHWGTKWDAYDQSIEPLSGDRCKLQFDTAWSHPAPVMEALAAKVAAEFPGEELLVEYADEDFGNNVGRYRILDGEVLDFEELSDDPQGLEVAARVKYGQTYAEVKAGWDEDEIDSARRYVFGKRLEKERGEDINSYQVIRDEGLSVPDDIVAAIATVEQAESVWANDSEIVKALV